MNVTPTCFAMDYYSYEIKSFVLLARTKFDHAGRESKGKENIEYRKFSLRRVNNPVGKVVGRRSNL